MNFQPISRAYALYIAPLDVWDAIILGGSAALAVVVATVAHSIFGKAFTALSVVMGFGLLLGGWQVCRYRTKQKFTSEAKAIFDRIIGFIDNAESKKKHFAEARNDLRAEKFGHLKDQLKEYDDREKEYFQAPNDESKKAFKTQVEGIKNSLR